MRFSRRQAIASGTAAAAIAVGGGTWWYLQEDEDPKGASDRIDLLAGAYAGPVHQSDPELYAMLTLRGGMPKNTTLEVRFFDLDGNALPPPQIEATLTNLVTGEKTDQLTQTGIGQYAVGLEQTAIQSDGWWQLSLHVEDLVVSWTVMLPDANLTGFDTPPTVEEDPEATALLTQALGVLKGRSSLRWWQWLSGGNGSVILSIFSITTTASNGLPNSFESDSLVAGQVPLDGSAPNFRTDNPRSVTIGDEGMRYLPEASPEAVNPIQYLPLDQYDTTYTGFDGAHFGITAEIDGVDCQLVAFHLPGSIEAWFAFWIETETATLRQLFMHSVNHYMQWVYFDIDEPFEISF